MIVKWPGAEGICAFGNDAKAGFDPLLIPQRYLPKYTAKRSVQWSNVVFLPFCKITIEIGFFAKYLIPKGQIIIRKLFY